MDQLLTELTDLDASVQTEAFGSILTVFRELGKEDSEASKLKPSAECSFPNEALFGAIVRIMDASVPRESALVIDSLLEKAMNRFLDIKYYTVRNFAKFVSNGGAELSEQALERIFDIMAQVESPTLDGLAEGEALILASPSDTPPYRRSASVKKELTALWSALIPAIPKTRVKKLLLILNDAVLPNIYHPELLADFLSQAYSSGGLVGFLALDGLFTLMRIHNMDFPSFYDKLYALLDEKIMHAPYRKRFFKLFRLFMSSTMVPAYVVAAMVKRVARLALAAPPSAIVWIIPFIYNMLHDHPTCRVLIHRSVPDNWIDPYDSETNETVKSNALDSSLWEILVLERHYWPRIARLAAIFREKFTKPSFKLDEIADGADQASLALAASEELSHLWSKRPATKIEIPESAF